MWWNNGYGMVVMATTQDDHDMMRKSPFEPAAVQQDALRTLKPQPPSASASVPGCNCQRRREEEKDFENSRNIFFILFAT